MKVINEDKFQLEDVAYPNLAFVGKFACDIIVSTF